MNILTKFDVGQIVWIMFNNKPEQWKIKSIKIPDVTGSSAPMPHYDLVFVGADHCGSIHETSLWEHQVHATKRELLMSFLTEND